MKKLVWLAGLLLVVALVYPNGITLPSSQPTPPAVVVPVDDEIVKILAKATGEDKAHVAGVYDAMATVLKRDNGVRIKNTERWSDYQANTLQLAIETPGVYTGLDVAIEAVFKREIGTDDVQPNNPETQQKLIRACEIVSASARK
jgi:hypothetical protein